MPPLTSSVLLQLPLGLEFARGELVDSAPAPLFRPIHYLGSKLRLATEIASALDSADCRQGPVLDLFAGSGTTALALAGHRKVIASDIQEYSRILCSALLSGRTKSTDILSIFQRKAQAATPLLATLHEAVAPLIAYEQAALRSVAQGAEQICAVIEAGSILAAERDIALIAPDELTAALLETRSRLARGGLLGSPLTTAVRYFGGAYFSYEQAVELDWLAGIAAEVDGELADIFRAALLSTASDTVNTVGKQFAQPIRPRSRNGEIKRHLLAKIVRDRSLCVRRTYSNWLSKYSRHQVPDRGHSAVQADYRDALARFAGQYSVVYADPPYTRDHYSRFYHVLETLVLRDNPAVARNPGASDEDLSRGIYREERHQSPFCIKSRCGSAFEELFSLAARARANLVLSYSPYEAESSSRPRLMHIEALLEIATKHYPKVELASITGISHSKLNHSRLNFGVPDEAEILLVCTLKP